MNTHPSHNNYKDVAIAITYLVDHAHQQPSLEHVANAVGLSNAHLQKIFSAWVGLSPKQFLKYINASRAKAILREKNTSLLRTSLASGLSTSSRLHDLFVTVESMSPGQFKSLQTGKGVPVVMNYSCAQTPYGLAVIASTNKGLAHLTFIDNTQQALQRLKESFPFARFVEHCDDSHKDAVKLFFDLQKTTTLKKTPLKLHLKGTPFQIKVWESLLMIPSGSLQSYGDVAASVGTPNAHRAVGTAVGKNPLAYIIPCHRVIQSSGVLGNYMWGHERKKIMIAHEADLYKKEKHLAL